MTEPGATCAPDVHETASIYPLTLPQREIWFDQMLFEQSPKYNIGGYARIAGVIDHQRFERAVNLLIRKHDCLRTVLIKGARGGDVPTQRFAADMSVRVPLRDFTSAAGPQASALEWMQARLDEPLPLYGEPLARYDLLKVGTQLFYGFFRCHHIIVDGWSVAILCRSLAQIYSALEQGAAPDLTAHSYVEFIKEDRSYVEAPLYQRQRKYWLEKYRDLPEPLLRPRYRSREEAAPRSACCPLMLPRELYDRLIALATSSQAAVFQVILAALYIYFVRATGRDELVVGLPVLNRANAVRRATAGLFVSVSAVRFKFGTELSFAELVRGIARVLKQDYRHQRFPISELNREVLLRTGREQIFDLQVSYERHDYDSMFGPAPARVIALLNSHQSAALTVFVREFHDNEDVGLDFVYGRAYFQHAEIEAIQRRMLRVFESIVDNANIPVKHISWVTSADAAQLSRWNATQQDYPQTSCIHELFEAQVERTPDAIALACGECSAPYGELNSKANRLARRLRELGVGPEVPVAICAERSPELVVGLLATLKAGGAYVPLDPAYPAERLSYMLRDSGAKVLLHAHIPAEVSLRAQDEVGAAVKRVDLCADAAQWADNSGRKLESLPGGMGWRNLAYVIYTSGSTGQPKGVMVEHRSVCNLVNWHCQEFGLAEGRRSSMTAGVGFDASGWEIWPTLCSGGTLVLPPGGPPEEPTHLLKWWQQQKLDVSFLVTPLAELACSEGWINPGLQYLLVGGDRLGRVPVRQGLVVVNNYGPTETTVLASSGRLTADEPLIHIGRPIANMQIHLLDGFGERVPVGVVGEIHVGGAGVARGYLNRPDLTADRFVTDPFSAEPDARMYRTGDLGRYLADGNLEYLGRTDHQVKIRGFRIEVEEVEVCLRQHGGIRQAVVLAREDQPGEKRLIAYVVGGNEPVDVGQLREWLTRSLPEYMLPVAYVQLESLPLTANGKLDRRALPPPDGAAFASREYEEPRGGLESDLARMWSQLLRVERVGRQDHFFELGGHSLLAVELMDRLRGQGLYTDVRMLFMEPTLAGMARAIRQAQEKGRIELVVPPNGIEIGCKAITPVMLPLVQLDQQQIDQIVLSVPGGAANVQDIYPLAPLQEGIFFHHLLQQQGDAYLLVMTLSFGRRERLDEFRQVLQQVINRHDVLRTAVLWEGLPEAVQVVWRQAELPVEEVYPDSADGEVAGQLMRRLDPRRVRMDLRQAPPMHLAIAQDAAKHRWLALLRVHHLAVDHTGLEIIQQEVQAYLVGRQQELARPQPFRNFVAQARSGVPRQEHEEFFRQMLGDVHEPTAPYGLLEVHRDGSEVQEEYHRLDSTLSQRIRKQARQFGVSPASIFHFVWAQVLSRTAARDDVVFGTVMSGRMHSGEKTGRALGMFINTLPVRMRLGGVSVAEGVQSMHQILVQLMRHEHASLALAQRCSRVAGDTPLFSALLNYRHSVSMPATAAELADIGMQVVSAEERTNYPCTLSVDDLGDEFALILQVVPPLPGQRMCGYVRQMLSGVVRALEQAPLTPARHVQVLDEVEREQLLVHWNATQRQYSDASCIHELFEEQVQRSPQSIAVVYEGHSLTYAALNARANQLARYLRERGVGPDQLAGLCVERSLEMVVGLLGIMKAGGAYVPLEPGYPTERLLYMLKDAAPAVVLTTGNLHVRLKETHAQLISLDADWQEIARHSADNLDARTLGLAPQHLAYVIYTSGSTGQPKGAMNEHRALVNRLQWMQEAYPIGCGDRVLQKTPFSFDVSVWEFFWTLMNGACLVVARPEGHKDREYLRGVIEVTGVTTLHFVPSMLQVFLNGYRAGQCSSLRRVVCSGEELTAALQKSFFDRMPGVQLCNLYGPTEAAIEVTAWECRAEEQSSRVPIGRPIANTRIYVLDEDREPVPIGVTGEIYIGGVGVARGYLNRPGLTAERFVGDPFSPQPDARMYRTGDLGRYREDGNLEYVGRSDHQVKIRGFRIELGEIEGCLQQQPGIRAAVVLAREDQPGEKRLVAYVVSEAGPLEVGRLREQLSHSLPEYMLPVAYVQLESLPLTANGKLDRRALPAPEGEAFARREYQEPQGELESALAQIWSELLGVERIGRQDHFFELGGHSLLAVQLVARVRQRLGLEVPLQELFAHPVLQGFAQGVSRAQRSQLPPLQVMQRPPRLPLSFAQQRLWFIAQLDGAAGAAYHIPAGLLLRGPLERAALQRALDRIVSRHEALRTHFELLEGQPVQRIAAAGAGFQLQYHDLRGQPEGRQQVRYWSQQEAHAGFDLQRGPLIRGRLLQLDEQEHALLVTMHHIVSDGWSLGVLKRELSVLYRAFCQAEADPLPQLSIQYADYALWQRQWLEDLLQQQLLYWKQELQGAPALISLPADRARPVVQDYTGERIRVELDEGLSGQLRALSRRQGTTLPMTLLAGWAALAVRLSGQTEVVIGTPVANRTRAEVEGLIGFFVNTLALRVEVSGDVRVGELLEQVRRRSVQGHSHQDVPFEQVVEGLRPVRSLSHSPIFQLMFTWESRFGEALDLGPLSIEALQLSDYRPAKYDLTLSLQEVGERIVGELEYASALYERGTMQRHVQYLLRLLQGMVADDQQRVRGLPLLSEAEREQLLVQWNQTQREYPQDRGIHELFESQVERTPEAVAVVCEGQSLTYAALNERANRLAGHLRDLGVGPEARVALCAERSIEMVVGLMATLKAGGVYVPLDPAYPSERLTYMLQDSRAAVLLHAQLPSQMPLQLQDMAGTAPALVDLCADAAQWATRSGQNQDSGARSHNLAYVIYTSGSTGRPKGVMTPHRGAVNRLRAQAEFAPFCLTDICCQKTSIGFVDSIYETLGPLTEGLPLVVAPAGVSRDLEQLTALIERAGVTCLVSVPSMAHALLEKSLSDRLRKLRRWTLSGEALEASLLRRLHEALPDCRIVNLYGSSEVCADVTSYVSDGHVEGNLVPIGRPIRNTRIYVLDEHREPVPIGVTGEIYIGGAGLARGYLNQPELTAERFVKDPFRAEAEAHIYRTGDLGRYVADGNLEYLGRTDHQVKIRGFRIELGEIERCLQQQSGIRAAVVLAREDQPGDKRLVAYVVSEGGPLDIGEIREQLSRKLPEYMLPVGYVQLESLPLTANGKLDRRALPAPEGTAFAQRKYEEPQGRVERALAQIWSELLRVERVGRLDHFFELGGHSLLAVQLMERMRRRGMYAEIRTLFTQPTLAGLAQRVEQARDQGWADLVVPANRIEPGTEAITPEMLPLVQLNQQQIDRIVQRVPGGAMNVQDIYPLAPLQEGIFFHHLLQQQGDAYLLMMTLSFEGRAQLDEFLQALQQVINRHDVLRTAVLWEGLRRPVQVVWREARLPVERVHLDAADGDIAEQLFARFDPRRVRMDVGQAPLVSVAIAHDERKDRWVMVLRAHHLAVDHTGMEIIQEEVQCYLQGRQHELAPAQPFRNFVARARLGSPNQEHEEFFRQMLSDVQEPTAPYGVLRVDRSGAQVQEAQQRLQRTLAQGIRRQARQLGVSAASLFHFAWAQVLGRTARRSDVVFGTVLLGRMYGGDGSDRALGMFINTLPLRVRLDEMNVADGIRGTHETLAQLMRHEHTSLVLAQRCSGLRGDVPLFSTLLNYRHRVLKSALEAETAFSGVRVLSVHGGTNYPCTLSVDDSGSDFTLTLQVVSPLPAQRICQYMQQALGEIVKALEQEPSTPALRIGTWVEEER